ncbi:MAG TPA: hypothetical protein VIH59_16050 [Candidatus Tectomicrobia bacterium]
MSAVDGVAEAAHALADVWQAGRLADSASEYASIAASNGAGAIVVQLVARVRP